MAINNKLMEYIKKELGPLPKELQSALDTIDLEQIIKEIGKNHRLTEEETLALQIETVLVLVSLTSSGLFKQNIEENIILSENETEKIANEISQKIFTPIYDILTKNIEENLKNKKPKAEQNLNFILSGGDYSAFMEKENNPDVVLRTPEIKTLDNSSKIADIKSRFTI